MKPKPKQTQQLRPSKLEPPAIIKHAPRAEPRRLLAGEIVCCDGARHVVVRVNESAATLKRYHPPRVEVVAGTEYEFEVEPTGEPVYVSAYASMERGEPGPERY